MTAPNTNPIYPLTPNVAWASLTAANTAKDGTGTVATVHTAGAQGSRVDRIRFRPLGTNVASVARVFVNNGATNTTASNNALLFDVSLPAITNSEVLAQQDIEIPVNIALPATYRLNVVLATAVAAGWAITAIGGDY